jgi:hypothetical protein
MSHCIFEPVIINPLMKIFMQVFFVFAFLSLFFFLYVVVIEKEIFDSQIKYVVNSIYDDLFQTFPVPQEISSFALKYVNQVTLPNESHDDITSDNNVIYQNTIQLVIIFGIIFFTCLIMCFLLRVCLPIETHILENIVILSVIALTEYLFLNIVTRNYIAADPNHIKLFISQQVKSYAQVKNSQVKK